MKRDLQRCPEKSPRGDGAQLTSTVENYLKVLYEQQQRASGDLVGMGTIASAMQVSPGTATAMMKSLAKCGHVRYEPRDGCALTPQGEELALQVLRRHRLVELFLVQILRLDWSEVHAEAEHLEHTISDLVLRRIDQLLGHPTVDPHGDPIPGPTGELPARRLQPLTACLKGDSVRVARVLDESPDFLCLLSEYRLQPGSRVRIETCNPAADAIAMIDERGKSVTLGTQAASKLLVEVDDA